MENLAVAGSFSFFLLLVMAFDWPGPSCEAVVVLTSARRGSALWRRLSLLVSAAVASILLVLCVGELAFCESPLALGVVFPLRDCCSGDLGWTEGDVLDFLICAGLQIHTRAGCRTLLQSHTSPRSSPDLRMSGSTIKSGARPATPASSAVRPSSYSSPSSLSCMPGCACRNSLPVMKLSLLRRSWKSNVTCGYWQLMRNPTPMKDRTISSRPAS